MSVIDPHFSYFPAAILSPQANCGQYDPGATSSSTDALLNSGSFHNNILSMTLMCFRQGEPRTSQWGDVPTGDTTLTRPSNQWTAEIHLQGLDSLEVQVLEGEVSFHNTSSFDSGPQHILLGGYVRTVGYPVQVIQVASGGERERKGWHHIQVQDQLFHLTLVAVHVSVCPAHYAAESFSWYSRERLKQAWTPPSFHSRWMTPASSPVMKPSSAEPARTNSCRASSWTDRASQISIRGHNFFHLCQLAK